MGRRFVRGEDAVTLGESPTLGELPTLGESPTLGELPTLGESSTLGELPTLGESSTLGELPTPSKRLEGRFSFLGGGGKLTATARRKYKGQ
jgi:hypothetical protein